MVYGIWYMVYGIWYTVVYGGIRYMVYVCMYNATRSSTIQQHKHHSMHHTAAIA